MGAPLDNMFLHWFMWPFIIAGLIHMAYINLKPRWQKSDRRMDSAAITHRDEFMEENPWDAN